MDKLNMPAKQIKNLINLKEDYWQNFETTNCYAFALGLDVPENNIYQYAYSIGKVASIIYNIPFEKIRKLSYEDRLFLDMEALEIECEKTMPNDQNNIEIKKDYTELCWIISLLSSKDDFHFARKSYNDTWYHKMGYFGFPSNIDSDKKIITDIEKCRIRDYEYVKSYKLSFKLKK